MIRGSSVVEQSAVNRSVVGSNPTRGASLSFPDNQELSAPGDDASAHPVLLAYATTQPLATAHIASSDGAAILAQLNQTRREMIRIA